MVATRVRPLVVNVTKLLGASAESRVRRYLAQRSTEGMRKLEDEVVRKLVQQKKVAYVKNPKGGTVLVEANTGCRILRSNGRPFAGKPAISRHISASVNVAAFKEHAASRAVEDYIPWMYLDSESNITVGIGHKLSGLTEAQGLNFVVRDLERVVMGPTFIPRVHPKHIENAYDLVLERTDLKDKGGREFEDVSHIDLTADEIDRLFEEDVEQKLSEITAPEAFPDFKTFPPLAKLGMLDMAFNAGVSGTKTIFPIFTAAVRRRDWKQAGKESAERKNEDRAEIVKGWFEKAAKQEPFFIDISCVKRLEIQR